MIHGGADGNAGGHLVIEQATNFGSQFSCQCLAHSTRTVKAQTCLDATAVPHLRRFRSDTMETGSGSVRVGLRAARRQRDEASRELSSECWMVLEGAVGSALLLAREPDVEVPS